jgi:hypothetical protein
MAILPAHTLKLQARSKTPGRVNPTYPLPYACSNTCQYYCLDTPPPPHTTTAYPEVAGHLKHAWACPPNLAIALHIEWLLAQGVQDGVGRIPQRDIRLHSTSKQQLTGEVGGWGWGVSVEDGVGRIPQRHIRLHGNDRSRRRAVDVMKYHHNQGPKCRHKQLDHEAGTNSPEWLAQPASSTRMYPSC